MKGKIARQLNMDMDSKPFCDEYAEVERELNKSIEQNIFYAIKNERLIGAVTLGYKVDSYITDCFENGFYMKGLLADAMANQILFALSERAMQEAEVYCRQKNCFLAKKIEIGEDVPLSFQEEIVSETEMITMTDTHMLSPLKSMTFLYTLSGKESELEIVRSQPCQKCTLRETCEMNASG